MCASPAPVRGVTQGGRRPPGLEQLALCPVQGCPSDPRYLFYTSPHCILFAKASCNRLIWTPPYRVVPGVMKTRGLSISPIREMSLTLVPPSQITFRVSSSFRSTISHLPASINRSLLFLLRTTQPAPLSAVAPRLRIYGPETGM